jgi:hypothetical protein
MRALMILAVSSVALGATAVTAVAQAPAAPASAATPAPEAEKQAIIGVVQKLFDAMAAKDAAAAASVLVPEARFFVPRDGEPPRTFTGKEFAERLPAQKSTVLERFWNPEVRVRGPIATIWTPYDFWSDGKFSHCGIDAFDLIKTAEGWKISGGSYTVERTGCAPSPLGPPR